MSEQAKGELLCRNGDVIFREGDEGSCMYRVLDGSVTVYADYGTEDQKRLTELHAGDFFGEMAVIEVRPRSATVVASADGTRLQVIEAVSMFEYLEANTGEINDVARHLSRRLRELTGDYVEVCDTLRELGRLDTSRDRVSDGLLGKVKKFAAVYLKLGKKNEEAESAIEEEKKSHKKGFSLPEKTYQKNDVIFREGDPSNCLYDIHGGRVGIFTDYGTEKQKLLTELLPDMFFGEMGLFETQPRSATAVALADETVLEPIAEKDLAELLAKNPAKGLLLLQHLSHRLRQLTRDYLKACKTLAETEESIEQADTRLTPEMQAQIEYMNQLLLMSDVLY